MSGKWKRYPAYRASGVDWFAETPVGWEERPLKHLTQFVNGAPFKPTDWGSDGTPIIRIENLNGGETFNRTKLQVDRRYHVNREDLLFGWSGNRGTSFGPFIWWREGLHYLNQHIFRLEGYQANKRWLYWMLKAVTHYVEEQAHGIIGMVHVTKGDLGVIKIPLPSTTEQQAIAAFLDRETAKIDGLVAKKERLIELLQEKRTALISHAVTRGLNPNAPLRDSGIPWIGRIPAHWEMRQLQWLVQGDRPIMYGIVLPGPHFEGGVPIVKGGDVEPARLRLAQLKRTAPEIEAGYERSRLRGGDLVYAIRGSIGMVEIVLDELEGANLTQDAARVAPGRCVVVAWLKWALKSKPVFAQLDAGANGATIRGINICDLKRASLPVPPIEEQRSIAAHLSRQTARLEELIAKIRTAVDRLQEYRTALISAAVTGQIDVREQG